MSEPLFVIRVMCFDFFLSFLFLGSNTLFPALLLVASTIQSLCQWCNNFPTSLTKASGYHKAMSLLPCKSANLVKDKLNDWTATGLMKRGKSSTHSSSDPYVCWYFNLVSLAMTDRYCVFEDSFLLWRNQLVHHFGLGPGYSLISCRLESANSFIAHWSFPGLSTSIRFHLVWEGHITCWTHQYIGFIVPLRKQMHIPVVQQLLQSLNILYLKSTKICLCLCRHATYRFNLNLCYSKQ